MERPLLREASVDAQVIPASRRAAAVSGWLSLPGARAQAAAAAAAASDSGCGPTLLRPPRRAAGRLPGSSGA
jgi:hypothetical protein